MLLISGACESELIHNECPLIFSPNKLAGGVVVTVTKYSIKHTSHKEAETMVGLKTEVQSGLCHRGELRSWFSSPLGGRPSPSESPTMCLRLLELGSPLPVAVFLLLTLPRQVCLHLDA